MAETASPAPLHVYYENEATLEGLQGKTVAVLGYGSQGHAHAQNLRESGVKVIVANRRDSANGKLAISHGFDPMPIPEAGRTSRATSSRRRRKCALSSITPASRR